MTNQNLTIRPDYWSNFQISAADLDFIYNHLLEIEMPQTTEELLHALIESHIQEQKQSMLKQIRSGGDIYLPKEKYQIGQILSFPGLSWQKGKVVAVRAGNNPELAPFDVIDIELENGQKQSFAGNLQSHALNQPISLDENDPNLNPDYILNEFGDDLKNQLTEELESSPDLVQIAWRWFPRALLVDVNEGHLNLAEAVLDMAGGGPMTTEHLLEQVDLPTDVNSKLTEFSFNLALQEDERFDEVGPSGEILWFLHRLEPAFVQHPPIFLRYNSQIVDAAQQHPVLNLLESQVDDEYETTAKNSRETADETTVSLIYPHWRAGTLPLSRRIRRFFPSAYESPRVQFNFIDQSSGSTFCGWVVRTSGYVSGLKEWYESSGVIPGSLIHIKRSSKPGEVIIWVDKRKNRDWVRTLLFGSDGGMVFALLKQQINTSYDERMATFVTDVTPLDNLWEGSNRNRQPLEQIVKNFMVELSKLNPQGHVHAQELYAAVNLIRRCPPAPIIEVLLSNSWVSYLGDLYFRLNEDS